MKKEFTKSIIFGNAAIKRLMKIADKEKIMEWLEKEYKLSDEKEKVLNFRSSTLEKLMEIVNIEQADEEGKFDEWFSYKYEIFEEEELFLKELIKENKFYLNSYNEQTLTVKFIGQILNKVKFLINKAKDWYEYSISCKLNNWTLNGNPDFFVATGIEEPKIPYFFLQEYKREIKSSGHPKYQLLAAMLTALTLNKKNKIVGGYVIGRYWNFLILEKLENGDYEYFVSKGLDCLYFDDLKKIYIILQAVKYLYCK